MYKKIMSLIVLLILIITPINSAFGLEVGQTSLEQNKILESIKNLSMGKEIIHIEENDDIQLFINGILSIDNSSEFSVSNAKKFLEKNKSIFKFESNKSNFEVASVETDELGFTHLRFKQMFDGKEVCGNGVVLHYDINGNLTTITGTLKNKIKNISKKNPTAITVEQAIEIAKESKEFDELSEDAIAENIIYHKNNVSYDAYKVNIVYDYPTTGSWNIFVDAYSGDIIDEVNLIRVQSVVGQGVAVNGTTRSLNLNYINNKYKLQDLTKNMSGTINTYTANYRNTTNGTLAYSTSSTVSDRAAVSAHSYAGVVYDFYKNLFNRNSINNSGMSINSVIHYGNNYNNAFWNGYKMVYGDGDGSVFTSLSGDLDVVAHEMTHGVTSYSGNMNYENQPGALNESVSDVFGVLIQTYDKYNVDNGGTWQFNAADWVVGDEIYTPNTPGDALRSLADPTLYDQPANMNNYQNLPNTSAGDYGGVHINSGIPNKAAYLLSNSIGCEKTARIYYRALTVYFNTTTNFAQARLGLIQAAQDLYGANSAEVNAVMSSFTAVGIN